MSRPRLALLAVLAVALVVLGLYAYGRTTCPPPSWWVSVFPPSGNVACVQ